MKKIILIVLVVACLYYFVFSKDKVTPNQLQQEERVLDYDIKYNDAVDKINEAVQLNLDNKTSIDKITEGVSTLEKNIPAENAQSVLDEIEKAKPVPD